MESEADLTQLIEDLRERNAELADHNSYLMNEIDVLKPIAEFRSKCRRFVKDCLYWKWVIMLIGVEVLRLCLDVEHSQDIHNQTQNIYDLLDTMLDAIAPGTPRG